MGIAFRPAREGDATALVGLVEELGYPSAPATLAVRLARLLAAPGHAVFVAEDDDAHELLGWLHAQESLSLADEPVALVSGLVVTASARGRGLGRGLMAEAESWARARGLVSMRLRARARRREAHAFYRRLGFSLAKKQLQFRKELGEKA
jgi:GNAT superfamily N-acetyltransferase